MSQITNELDKREGSIIFDALAPAMYELANFYLELDKVARESYIQTTHTKYLDMRVAEQGLVRFAATKAIKKGKFKYTNGLMADKIPLGHRFSTILDENPIIYSIKENLGGGEYNLECDVSGIIGNYYTGNLIPVDYINTLEYAILEDLVIPGRDEETDDELRARYFDTIKQNAFGGNIAQYKKEISNISGVGGVQVYPVWNGGGTVKLSIIDTEYNPITDEFKRVLQQEIDPENHQGKGLGIAPIGHHVTIDTPEEKVIDISADIVLSQGVGVSNVQSTIEQHIRDYFKDLKSNWDLGDALNNYTLDVYIGKISSIIFSVKGVLNVKNVKLNSVGDDVKLEQTSTKQLIPKLGSVSLAEIN